MKKILLALCLATSGCGVGHGMSSEFKEKMVEELVKRIHGQTVEPGVKFYYRMEHSVGAEATGTTGILNEATVAPPQPAE